ncbi:MAG: FAD-binding protein, partial [Candidatus Andersenbacteria bacterium]
MINYEAYAKRRDALSARMKGVKEGESVRLQKDTSNLFRNYKVQAKRSLNVRDFNHVLEVNAEEGWIEVEGMTTYNAIVTEALRCGVMPTVVPQLKSITIGG